MCVCVIYSTTFWAWFPLLIQLEERRNISKHESSPPRESLNHVDDETFSVFCSCFLPKFSCVFFASKSEKKSRDVYMINHTAWWCFFQRWQRDISTGNVQNTLSSGKWVKEWTTKLTLLACERMVRFFCIVACNSEMCAWRKKNVFAEKLTRMEWDGKGKNGKRFDRGFYRGKFTRNLIPQNEFLINWNDKAIVI